MKNLGCCSAFLCIYIMIKLSCCLNNDDICDVDDTTCLMPNINGVGELIWEQCYHVGILRRIKNTNLLTCAKECFLTSGCELFNYRKKWKLCDLVQKIVESGVVAQPQFEQGCIHSSITTWPKTLAGKCAEHNCKRGTRCSYASTGIYCHASYCAMEPLIDGVVTERFGLYRNIGHGIKFECMDDYNLIGIPYAFCRYNNEGNGVWETSFSCVPASCPHDKGYLYHKTFSLCYKLYILQKSYLDAREQCLNEEGDLLRIDSAEKQELIMSYLNSTGGLLNTEHIFIQGRNTNNLWTWTYEDGTHLTYTSWGNGQPTSLSTEYLCLSKSEDFLWNNCTVEMPQSGFLCEIHANTP